MKFLHIKKNIKLFYYIAFLITFFSNKLYSQEEIIINGDMEYYGNYSNFEYVGGGYTTLSSPFSGISTPGQNASCLNPNLFNTSFISSADHTSGFGFMLVVDGSTLGTGQYFWKGGYNGQGFCGLTIDKVYTFSYWVKSVSTLVTDTATQADIKIDFSNATDITLVAGNSMAPLPISGWQKVAYTFKATNYCVTINLRDANTNAVGNDFVLDDFSLFPVPPPLSVTYSLSNGNCDTTLFPYTSGGNINIKSYSLTGLAYSNNTGNFNNLLPGNYVLSVVDIDGNSASTNVVIPQPSGAQLTISPDLTICAGDNTNLAVNGSSTDYYWTSKPNDSSMTSNTGPSLTVSPATTTVYTVRSYGTNGSGNLIYNGDFSMGNTGFDSQHVFYPTNFENAAGAYSVVPDASLWGTNFPSCGDHTTGTGNMLVVNGTDHLSSGGGTSFWEQAVSVLGTTNYTFSFWVKSLSGNFPATIHVIINGSIYNVYPYLAPSSTVCGDWVQYSMNYFSGWLSNVAVIQLTDTNLSFIGNDFAIDDISFITTNSCLSKTVTVTVDQSASVSINHNSTTPNAIIFDWNALPEATGYTISYSVNNAMPIDGGTVTTNSFAVSGLSGGDTVNIVVTPIGTGCFVSENHTGYSFSPCPIPLAAVTQQPTCSIPLGKITVSAPLGTQYNYSLDGIMFQPSPVFTNLVFGNYTITAKNTSTGCQANSSSLSLNKPDLIIPNISASYTYQNCSIKLVASSSTPNTSIVWNGPNLVTNTPNPSSTSSTGTYTATVTDILTGCTNDFNLYVIPPRIPQQPSVAVTQPSCFTSTGSIEITAPLDNNYEYSINGTNYQSGINFQNLTPATYFITAKDITTGCVSTINQIQLSTATITAPTSAANNITLCKNSIPSALSALALPNATLNWYGTNASGGIPSAIATIPDTSNLGSTTYYCSQTLGLCESARIAITVNISGTALVPDFEDLKYCLGDNNIAPLNTISPNGINGTWEPATISSTASGNYMFTPNSNECATTKSIAVIINLPITISFDWIVKEAFAENQVLTITTPQGNYLYQLDSGIPQISPVFENITQGIHTVTVIDSNGCSDPITRNDIVVINYPKFFTPNNDGYNDFWSIPELFYDPNAFIQIYDRYGKLLKILNLKDSDAWDGMYNEKLMPSTDYWFVVNYSILDVLKTFKAHFSLKR